MNGKMITASLGVLFWLGAAPAQAVNCNDPINQMEINHCAGVDFKQADQILNRAWRAIPKADRKGKLLKAQRLWIKFRDLQCDVESEVYAGGSMQPTVYHGCRARMTRIRTKELLDYMQP